MFCTASTASVLQVERGGNGVNGRLSRGHIQWQRRRIRLWVVVVWRRIYSGRAWLRRREIVWHRRQQPRADLPPSRWRAAISKCHFCCVFPPALNLHPRASLSKSRRPCRCTTHQHKPQVVFSPRVISPPFPPFPSLPFPSHPLPSPEPPASPTPFSIIDSLSRSLCPRPAAAEPHGATTDKSRPALWAHLCVRVRGRCPARSHAWDQPDAVKRGAALSHLISTQRHNQTSIRCAPSVLLIPYERPSFHHLHFQTLLSSFATSALVAQGRIRL